jgi:hypothetical protein
MSGQVQRIRLIVAGAARVMVMDKRSEPRESVEMPINEGNPPARSSGIRRAAVQGLKMLMG